jgi:DNA polymerase-3 subunit delta
MNPATRAARLKLTKMAAAQSNPLALVCGDDDFAVKQRAKQLYEKWSAELGGMDHEIIEATAANSGDALKALGKLRESLQTLPFFGSGKVIWLRDCNFLGEERAASAAVVTETLAELADELKKFAWQNVRLLISAGKVDKRKVFYKMVEKIGAVEVFAGWVFEGKDAKAGFARALQFGRNEARKYQKQISEDALAELISRAGENARTLTNEIEKLTIYVGQRDKITLKDVTSICTRNKMAKSFALADALGERDLPLLMRRLDEELWEIRSKTDKDKSEIGLLYGLVSKVRALILLKEMLKEGWIKPTDDYGDFTSQLERVPPDQMPAEKKFNPLALSPYVLYKALPQVKKYSSAELVRAMDLLLRCNQRLVSSGLDEVLVLQQALVQIVTPTTVTA